MAIDKSITSVVTNESTIEGRFLFKKQGLEKPLSLHSKMWKPNFFFYNEKFTIDDSFYFSLDFSRPVYAYLIYYNTSSGNAGRFYPALGVDAKSSVKHSISADNGTIYFDPREPTDYVTLLIAIEPFDLESILKRIREGVGTYGQRLTNALERRQAAINTSSFESFQFDLDNNRNILPLTIEMRLAGK